MAISKKMAGCATRGNSTQHSSFSFLLPLDGRHVVVGDVKYKIRVSKMPGDRVDATAEILTGPESFDKHNIIDLLRSESDRVEAILAKLASLAV